MKGEHFCDGMHKLHVTIVCCVGNYETNCGGTTNNDRWTKLRHYIFVSSNQMLWRHIFPHIPDTNVSMMRIFHREWYVYIDVNHYFNGIIKAFNMPFGWLTDACYSQLSV